MNNKIESGGSLSQEYLHFKRELQEQMDRINSNVSTLIKDGADGICNRVKDLLHEINENDIEQNYSIEQLPIHESEEQSDDEEAKSSSENVPMFSNIENVNRSSMVEKGEKKVRKVAPFFTVINADDSQDAKYKEMCQTTLDTKKNFSLVTLEKKIERRNDFLNKFGKTYTITNLI